MIKFTDYTAFTIDEIMWSTSHDFAIKPQINTPAILSIETLLTPVSSDKFTIRVWWRDVI
jgi:hypothetical protein